MTQHGKPTPLSPLSASLKRIFQGPSKENGASSDADGDSQLIPNSDCIPSPPRVNLVDDESSEDQLEEEYETVCTPERWEEILRLLRTSIPDLARRRRKNVQQRAEYARLCILDAFQGRLKNGLASNSKKSKRIFTIFSIQTSASLLYTVIYACAFHTLSIFFEPENACSSSTIYYFMQVSVILIYIFDIAFKMSYQGLKEYWGHSWQQVYVIVTALICMDLLVCGCTHYSNFLRPAVGILRARNGRRFFNILKKMVPGMSHSLIPLLFFLVMVMVVSTLLFDKQIPEFADSYYVSYNWVFLIFTNDNFDRVLPGHMRMNICYLVFFFPVVYVGQQFLLNLIVGETYETYKSFVKKQLKKERIKEMQGLTKAFSALDEEKSGSISFHMWRECLNKLDPDISPEAIALYFALITGGVNQVSVLQFLSLRSVLRFNLRLKKKNRRGSLVGAPLRKSIVKAYDTIHISIPWFLQLSYVANHFLDLVGTRLKLWEILNSIDLVVLCMSLSDYPVFELFEWTVTPCLMVNFAYGVEYILRLLAYNGKVFDMPDCKKRSLVSKCFVAGVVLRFVCMFAPMLFNIASNVPLVVSIYKHFPLGEATWSSFALRKTLLISRALRCVRLANLNTDLRNFTAALLDVLPALVETFGFTFLVTYIFGAAGNLLFGAYLAEWRTPLLAVVKVQQLSLGVDFLGSMEEAMEKVHITAVAFFFFYLILVMAVSNIALSIIIDLQNNVLDSKSSKDRDAEAERMEIVFEKIKQKARERSVVDCLAKDKHPLFFNRVVMSPFQSRDVRHFIADEEGASVGGGVCIDDIKKCAPHSNIDLVSYFMQKHKKKDLNLHWEVDFIKNITDCGVKTKTHFSSGDTVFIEGDPAESIYLLLDGSLVLTQKTERGRRATIQGTNFLGTESLQPSGVYTYTCKADSAATLLVISKRNIEDDLDSELCGVLLRMSFKSNTNIAAAFEDARRLAFSRSSRSLIEKQRSPRSPFLRKRVGSDTLHIPGSPRPETS